MDQPGCTIGIDMGTTNVKAIAFDALGHEVGRADQTLSLHHDGDGAAEQDPIQVYAAVAQVIGQAAEQAYGRGFTVERVGLSAAMHSLIPVDQRDQPLMQALTWMDTRAEAQAHALWDSPEGKAIYARTGTPIHAMAPIAKLLWLRQQRPHVFEQAARFVSLKEWIWHTWFGEWKVDESIASATGLYNLRGRDWDAGALEVAGITRGQLSAIVPTSYVRERPEGVRSGEAPPARPVLFNIGASDGVLANLGAGTVASGSMVMTIGTSCAVRSATTEPVTDPETRAFCYVLDDTRYIVGGPSNSGGIVLDWLYHVALGHQRAAAAPPGVVDAGFAEIMHAAEHAPRAPDLYCVPYVAGERAPLWHADAKAVIFGLQLQHSSADIMRAAVEGILLNAYWIAEGLFAHVGRPAHIVASGKVLQPEWVRHMAADIFGVPIVFRGAVDASAAGAAIMAEAATGMGSLDERARNAVEVTETMVQPTAGDVYARKFAGFQQIVRTLTTGALADIYLGRR